MYDIVPQLFVACFISAYTAFLAILLWSGLTARLKPAALEKLFGPGWVRIRKTVRSWAPHLESRSALFLRGAKRRSSPSGAGSSSRSLQFSELAPSAASHSYLRPDTDSAHPQF